MSLYLAALTSRDISMLFGLRFLSACKKYLLAVLTVNNDFVPIVPTYSLPCLSSRDARRGRFCFCVGTKSRYAFAYIRLLLSR